MYHKLLDRSLPLQKVMDAWQQIGGMDKAGAGREDRDYRHGHRRIHPAFQDAGLAMPDGFPKLNKSSDCHVYRTTRSSWRAPIRNPETRQGYTTPTIRTATEPG